MSGFYIIIVAIFVIVAILVLDIGDSKGRK